MRRLTAITCAGLLGTAMSLGVAGPAHADEIRDSQWMIDALQLETAHEVTKGSGVTVGLVDTGVDADHPDLKGQVVGGYDTWRDDGDGTSDEVGHGTAMASLIAGHGHGEGNTEGILGVAPEAKILSVGAMPPGEETFADRKALNDGIRWLADNGADVILLAYGTDNDDADEHDAVKYAVETKNIPVIAAAGNTYEYSEYFGESEDKFVDFPAAYEETLAVSGTDSNGKFSDKSVADINVSIAAPLEGVSHAQPGGKYSTEGPNGTSDSAAIVAGAMALLRAEQPDLTANQLAYQITETADDKGKPGPDNKYGYGIVNPVAALTTELTIPPGVDEDPQPPDPLQDEAEAGTDDDSKGKDSTKTLKPASALEPILWWSVGAAALTALAITFAIVSSRRRAKPHGKLGADRPNMGEGVGRG